MIRDFSEFPAARDSRESCAVYRQWAEQEWVATHANKTNYSPAYHRGFVDGFVDAVYSGGNGDPPYLPPKRYWRVFFRNAQGDQELTDWNEGFRVGARAALDGGYRERAVVPSSQWIGGAQGETAVAANHSLASTAKKKQKPPAKSEKPSTPETGSTTPADAPQALPLKAMDATQARKTGNIWR